MSRTDLFTWIDSLWNKERPEGSPPTYLMHRFLASDRDLAPFAHALQLKVRDPELVYRIWQGLLPKAPRADRLQYVAAKRKPDPERLVLRMCAVLSESRRSVEQIIDIVRLAGRIEDLYREYGEEMPDEDQSR